MSNAILPITLAELRDYLQDFADDIAREAVRKALETRPANELMTTAEVCDALHVCRGTLGNWERTGLLTPVQRVGKQKRYSRQMVEALMKN